MASRYLCWKYFLNYCARWEQWHDLHQKFIFCEQISAVLVIIVHQIVIFSVISGVANRYCGWVKMRSSQETVCCCPLWMVCEKFLVIILCSWFLYKLNKKQPVKVCLSSQNFSNRHLLTSGVVWDSFPPQFERFSMLLVPPQSQRKKPLFLWRKSVAQRQTWS